MRRMSGREGVGENESREGCWTLEVSVETIAASGEIGIDVMVELCQCVLDGRGMPHECALSVVVQILEEKGNAMNCGAYRRVKLLEHAMKIVEKVLEKNVAYGESGRDAVWFYAWQRNKRNSAHFEEVTRGVLGQEVVYVLC